MVLSQVPTLSRDAVIDLRSQPLQQVPLLELSAAMVKEHQVMTKQDLLVHSLTSVVQKVQNQSKGQSFRRGRRRWNRTLGFVPTTSASGTAQTSGARG